MDKNSETSLHMYVPNERTMKVSGKTIPIKAAQAAHSILNQNNLMPEFFYIGGNAGQQAMKAMSILRYRFALESPDLTLAFVPVRVLCQIKEDEQLKDAVVWRSIILQQPNDEITDFSRRSPLA